MKENGTKKVGGVTANALIFPLLLLIAVLHIFIINLIVEVTRSEDSLTDLISRSGLYQQTATNLQAGTSILSETASGYVQVPVTPDGASNVGPLTAFAEELGNDRRGDAIAARFRGFDVSDEVRGYIDDAAEQSNRMLEVQLRVIALVCSVYPTPPVPALAAIPDVPLTEEELAMPDEARLGYARQMIQTRDYSQLKSALTKDIENCHETLQQEIARATAKTQNHIASLRTALWAVVFTIIGALTGTFILYYHWLIHPLRSYARQISSDEAMEQKSVIREMRVMVDAYNTLLRRRNKLDDILRAAAETDALTGLLNRAGFERAALDIAEEGGATAVLLFDVNYLKRVNDTQGHFAGDQLIRTAADCIRTCFGQGEGGNCYRIGGDEFAAVLRGCGEAELEARIGRFDLALEREGISVSYGSAFAEETDDTGFKALMDAADKNMYEQKKHIHELNRTDEA